MKRLSIRIAALLSVLVLAALIQGCNSAAGAPVDVKGKWTEVDGPDSVQFNDDGSFTGSFVFDADGFTKPISGKYSASGSKITLTASDDPKASMVWNVTLTNGVLNVTYKQGGLAKLDNSTAKFHRGS
jgi:predicted small secreted protein